MLAPRPVLAASAPANHTTHHHTAAKTRLPPALAERSQIDQPGDALELYAPDQGVEQLAAHHLGAILHLEQVVQRVRESEHGIVPKWVIPAIGVRIEVCAQTWRAGIAIVVVHPQVVAVVILFRAARRPIACQGQLSPPCEVILIPLFGLLPAIGRDGEQPLEHALAQCGIGCQTVIALPQAGVRESVGPKPQVPLATDAGL
eukprot:6491772-Prymnesium_polylepis.1